MRTRELWAALITATVIGVCGWWIHSRPMSDSPAHAEPVVLLTPVQSISMSRAFMQRDLVPFLAAATKSEEVADPLQRCLSFPDPPQSHWSPTAVAAYCRYQLQPVISQADVLDLIRGGHADTLDRRLADAWREKQSRSDSRGLLYRTYEKRLCDMGPEMRLAIEAWKRQSPRSAFAYTASGCSYLRAASDARGYGFADQTPQSSLDAMDAQLRLALPELDKAVALDPDLTIAYSDMVHAALLSGDVAYALRAANRGLAVDPSDYAIYDNLLTLAEPKWSGSEEAMLRIAVHGLYQSNDNPLLLLLLPKVAAYRAGFHGCVCRFPVDLDAFPVVFDQAASLFELDAAGRAAAKANLYTFAVVYDLETLRFDPEATSTRKGLILALLALGRSPMAVAEANTAVAMGPRDPEAYVTRGYAYEQSRDYPHAVQDFRNALSLSPDDDDALTRLGELYVEYVQDWDKGWDVANQLVKSHPDDPSGWILRAAIQRQQPRPGELETANYIVQHFSKDPRAKAAIATARTTLEQASQHK